MLSHLISVPGTRSFISAVGKDEKRLKVCPVPRNKHAAACKAGSPLRVADVHSVCGCSHQYIDFSRCGAVAIIRLGRSLLDPGVFAGGVCLEGRAVSRAAAAEVGVFGAHSKGSVCTALPLRILWGILSQPSPCLFDAPFPLPVYFIYP